MNEWISVKDKLPSDETGKQELLVMSEKGNIHVVNYYRVNAGLLAKDDGDTVDDISFSHWMVLPKPPIKEETMEPKTQPWISFKDKKPEHLTRALVLNEKGYIHDTSSISAVYHANTNVWVISDANYRETLSLYVTHYLPITKFNKGV